MRGRRAGIASLVMLAAGALASPAAWAAAGPRFTPAEHHDAADVRQDPLDLRAASFGQMGTQLSLTLRTRRAWTGGGSVCVALSGDRPLGRLCVAANRSRRPVARFRPAGSSRTTTVRGAEVGRHGRTVHALVYPRALGLRPGSLRWFVTSRWHKSADRLPDSGDLPVEVSVYGAPRCFGAAARAGETGCSNPALERLVTPAPAHAELSPDFPCHAHHIPRYSPAVPCEFGADYAAGPPGLALIGDSHAMAFRSTADVAAQALGLKAISLTQAGCGFATEVEPGWPPVGKRCRRNNEGVLRWLDDHPSVHTVLVVESAAHGYTEDGLRAMWSRIPASVHRIHVVVDVPRVSYKTAGCVKAVRKRHAVSDGACAVPRDEKSLPPDPAPGAVAKSRPRVHLIDLTRYFCDSEHCFPVIGGAYVYRDTNHMNTVFAATLGPYLLDAMGGSAG
jgi:SGNH domain (fused to AT3 domains)